MGELMRVWLIAILALTLGPLASDGTAQSQQPGDPWQFPALTQRKAFQRWWWDFQQRAYPLSDIPENAKQRALEEITQFRAGLPPPSQPVQGTGWVNIGPAPILGGQIGVTGKTRPMSGRVAAIAVDPSDANHWFIGAAQGGIWETRDAGVTWSPKTDAQASLAIGAIAFAPSKPDTIYVGTGESVFSGDAYAGAGLLKSTDGGTTWQLLATSTFAKTSFSDLKVHPTNPDIVLAATTHGSFGRGADSLPSSLVKARGIFKSTDSGATWLQKLNGTATAWR